MDLKQISKEIYENAKAKGFWDKERNLGEMLMLIVSELSEAMEADRNGKFYDKEVDFVRHNQGEFFKTAFERHCKSTFEDELADVVIRILDLAHSRNIDLEWHIMQKMRYNSMREHMHGKKY